MRIIQARSAFTRNGFAAIPKLLSAEAVGALRRHYRSLVKSGSMSLGDEQCARRYVMHNEPVARHLQQCVTRIMSEVSAKPIKPSYTYSVVYLSGAELPCHRDRVQCEYSITICIDFWPDPAQTTSWPINLVTSSGPIAIYQGLGDALFYRGRILPHFRTPLSSGHTSTSLLLHYVDEALKGPLE